MDATRFLANIADLANSSTTGYLQANGTGSPSVNTAIQNAVSVTGDTVKDIFCNGGYITFLIWTTQGKLFIFGGLSNAVATMGNDTPNTAEMMTEIQFPSYLYNTGATIIDVRAVGWSYYVLFSNGELYVWGYNGYGQLGLGNTTTVTHPVLSTSDVASLVTRKYAASACDNSGGYLTIGGFFILKNDGNFYSAGYNAYGQLGTQNTTSPISSWTLIPAPTGKTLSQLYPSHTYNQYEALFCKCTDGTIWGCGYNGVGQLGLGNTTSQTTWQQVTYFNNIQVAEIYQGGGDQNSGATSVSALNTTIVLDTSGNIYTCGYNINGQCANGGTTNISSFYAVTLTKKVASVIKSSYFSYVIFTDGNWASWGYNPYGALGTGNVTNQTSPFYGSFTVSKIFLPNAPRQSFTAPVFLLGTDGTLWTAGYNGAGKLGVGNVLIGAGMTTVTKVPFNNAANINNIVQWDLLGSGATLICINNSRDLYGAGSSDGTFYGLNTLVTGDHYGFFKLPNNVI